MPAKNRRIAMCGGGPFLLKNGAAQTRSSLSYRCFRRSRPRVNECVCRIFRGSTESENHLATRTFQASAQFIAPSHRIFISKRDSLLYSGEVCVGGEGKRLSLVPGLSPSGFRTNQGTKAPGACSARRAQTSGVPFRLHPSNLLRFVTSTKALSPLF